MPNNFPKLHNAMWPGIVGKGTPDSEPIIPLDTLLELTANAEFDGPEVRRRRSLRHRAALRHRQRSRCGQADDRPYRQLWPQGRLVRVADLGRRRRRLGDGVARGAQAFPRARSARPARSAGRCASSASGRPAASASTAPTSVEDWDKDPNGNTKLIAETFRKAAEIAADHGEFLVAEGEICWGGMHSWRAMRDLLEAVEPPGVVGYQADMAHIDALHARLQRRAGSHPAGGLRLERQARRSTPPTSRWRTRSVPGRSTSTSRRTTAPSSAAGDHAKTGRHVPVDDPERPPRYRQARRLLAARRPTAS